MILEVTPAEFFEINDAVVALPDSVFAAWLVEHFGKRCPDLQYGLGTVEVRVVGRINSRTHPVLGTVLPLPGPRYIERPSCGHWETCAGNFCSQIGFESATEPGHP